MLKDGYIHISIRPRLAGALLALLAILAIGGLSLHASMEHDDDVGHEVAIAVSDDDHANGDHEDAVEHHDDDDANLSIGVAEHEADDHDDAREDEEHMRADEAHEHSH